MRVTLDLQPCAAKVFAPACQILDRREGERIGMKFRFLGYVLLAFLLFCLAACSNANNPATATGTGVLYVTAQANTTISAFSVNLSSGALGAVGSSLGTGAFPSAIAVTPAINALFVANSGGNSISGYAVNSDGSLTAAAATTPTGTTPT